MSGKKMFVFEMSDWFLSREENTQLPPADMEAVKERMQAAIDRDLADAEARQAAVAAAVGRLSPENGARFEAVDRRFRELAERPGEAAADRAGDSELTVTEPDGSKSAATESPVFEQDGFEAAAAESAGSASAAAESSGSESAASESAVFELAAADSTAADSPAFEPADFDERTAAAVQQWRHDAEVIRDLIISTLPHERYRPGQVAAIGIRLDSAAADAAQGRYRAALAACQDAFHELNELRAELELRHAEWLTARREAAGALLPVEHATTGVLTIPLRDAEGRELAGTSFDLDHWSHGGAAALREEVAAIAAELRSEDPGPALDRLIVIRDELGPDLARRWQRVVAEAEYQVHASQVRGNIADDVMVAIRETAGFLVDQWGYERGDERGGVYGRLRHPAGDQIVIEVMADPGPAPASRVRVLAFDHAPEDEQVMEQRVRAVVEALRARQLPVSDPVREPGPAELEFLDVPALIRAVVPESFDLVRIEIVEEPRPAVRARVAEPAAEEAGFEVLDVSGPEEAGFEVLDVVEAVELPSEQPSRRPEREPEPAPPPVQIRRQGSTTQGSTPETGSRPEPMT